MKSLALLLAIAAPVAAFAQSRSSFTPATFTGVTITPSNGGLTQLVSLGATPTLTVGSNTYNITDVFGFWALDNEDPNLSGSTSNFGVWNAHSSTSGSGAIIGWKTNPNSGFTPGQSQSFTFNSLDNSDVENWGMHVRIDGQLAGGGNTAYFEYNAVPEPASLAALGIGAIALIRRRRSK